MIWDPYERFIWGIAITLTLICGAYFIRIGRKREAFKEKMFMFGMGSLPLGFAASLIIVFIQVIQIQGSFNDTNYIFYGEYSNFTLIYIILEIVSNAILGLTGMFFVLAFEVIVKRTKYILTIIFSILVVMVIFLPLFSKNPLVTARFVYNYFILPGLVIFIPLILYLYTKWSSPKFKAVASFFLFGFLSFMYSLILALRAHKSLNSYPIALSPILLILGCCSIIIPLKIKPKMITRALFYWVFFLLLVIPLFVVIIIVDIAVVLEKQPEEFSPSLIGIIIGLDTYIYTLFYLIIKNTRSELASIRLEKEPIIETKILELFTRPQKITEEEVTVSYEKKICLVCEGKLKKEMYICPDCDTFYCKRCSDALVNLENACWVCNFPFDESRPVTPFKKEDQIESEQKKQKPPKSI